MSVMLLTDEDKKKFLSGLPPQASVGDIALLWIVMAIAFRLSAEEITACLGMCGRAVLDGRYAAELNKLPDSNKVRH